jgi:hypothetical protein
MVRIYRDYLDRVEEVKDSLPTELCSSKQARVNYILRKGLEVIERNEDVSSVRDED